MLLLYLIIATVLLSTYCRPIAVFYLVYCRILLACHFYYYVLYMHSGSINKCRRGRQHESRGECHGNAFNLFAPIVLLGPSGPWLR